MIRSFFRLAAISAVCLYPLAASVFAQQETRYTVLMMGKPAGVQTSAAEPGGVREFTFEYNDRGRGPKIRQRLKLDSQGLPVSIEIAGNDYLKAPIAESLTIVDGIARWKSTAEAGEKKFTGNSFYISMYGAPEELATFDRSAGIYCRPGDGRCPWLEAARSLIR